jgi:hypothetical protein
MPSHDKSKNNAAADQAWIDREFAGVADVRQESKRARMARRMELAEESFLSAADEIRDANRQSRHSATKAEAALTRGLFDAIEAESYRPTSAAAKALPDEYRSLVADRGETGAAAWMTEKVELIRDILSEP